MPSTTQPISTESASLPATANHLFPVFLKLEQLNTLLVGAGYVGHEKLQALLSNAPLARITVVAPQISEGVRALAASHSGCALLERAYEAEDLQGRDLVVLATDQPALHEEIRTQTRERGILVNVADTPALCDFYLGSIVQKGQLKIAISTNGQSPTAAKRIKEVLQETLPDQLDEVIRQLHQVRNQLDGDFASKVKRLNDITRVLVENGNEEKDNRWRKIATYLLVIFGLMLVGHFIFSYLPFQ